MTPKWFIWFFLILGSTIGSYLPLIWGGQIMSFSSVLFSTIGGLLGIWAAIKIGNSL